jgi:hypothetical protein
MVGEVWGFSIGPGYSLSAMSPLREISMLVPCIDTAERRKIPIYIYHPHVLCTTMRSGALEVVMLVVGGCRVDCR